jgi:uncharacterized Ntn-hydrolase superfamily protein
MRIENRSFPLIHTYSIVARDPAAGCLGVAVQSHWFSVGGSVAWAEAGVGAIATQAWGEPSYGPLGLELMRAGKTPRQALDALLAADEQRELRQVAMVDASGAVAAHTGKRCLQAAGNITGDGFSVQVNMMLSPAVPQAMAQAYRSSQGDLAERLLCALEAAQAAGGDIRGQQSACLKVVSAKRTGAPWTEVLFDLRVEDHPSPLVELRRLVQVQRGFTLMNQGDDFLAKREIDRAMEAYAAAEALVAGNLEPAFWHAVALADLGRTEEALAIFARVARAEPAWAELYGRLSAAGFAKENPEVLRRLQGLKSGTQMNAD